MRGVVLAFFAHSHALCEWDFGPPGVDFLRLGLQSGLSWLDSAIAG